MLKSTFAPTIRLPTAARQVVRPESHTDLVSRAVDPNDLASMALQQELLHAWCSLLGLPAPAHGQLTVSVDDQAKVLVAVSYTHLTLPTNREV